MRELLSLAAEVQPDKQGRILVPALLQEAAGLEEGPVVLNGNIDRIELWSAEALESKPSKPVPEDVAGYAQRILG